MVEKRTVTLLVAAVIVLSVTIGAGGAMTMTADRNVVLSAVDDEHAYVGFEQTVDRSRATANLTVRVTNQFPPDTALRTVTVTVGSDTQSLVDAGTLKSGESATATFSDVDCSATITVEVSGDGATGTLERPVSC